MIAKDIKDDEGNSIEVWYARELQQVLGYARWENFVVGIGRALESCKTLGINVDDHFREVTKMVQLGSGSQREVQEFMLTRYACYLIAQNGDPKKENTLTRFWKAIKPYYLSTRRGRIKSSALTDYLQTLTIAAKNLAEEITNCSVGQKDLYGEAGITAEHLQNNRSVCGMLGQRGVMPKDSK